MSEKLTDKEITAALAVVLGSYCADHPEVGRIKVRCYSQDDGLLYDFHFSPARTAPTEPQRTFVKQIGAREDGPPVEISDDWVAECFA